MKSTIFCSTFLNFFPFFKFSFLIQVLVRIRASRHPVNVPLQEVDVAGNKRMWRWRMTARHPVNAHVVALLVHPPQHHPGPPPGGALIHRLVSHLLQPGRNQGVIKLEISQATLSLNRSRQDKVKRNPGDVRKMFTRRNPYIHLLNGRYFEEFQGTPGQGFEDYGNGKGPIVIMINMIEHLVGWQVHRKKDGSFLQNLFIWYPEVQKSDVVPTDHSQIYGLPLTSHIILGQNRGVLILAKITWDVNGSP